MDNTIRYRQFNFLRKLARKNDDRLLRQILLGRKCSARSTTTRRIQVVGGSFADWARLATNETDGISSRLNDD